VVINKNICARVVDALQAIHKTLSTHNQFYLRAKMPDVWTKSNQWLFGPNENGNYLLEDDEGDAKLSGGAPG